jgi:hypothetical protein
VESKEDKDKHIKNRMSVQTQRPIWLTFLYQEKKARQNLYAEKYDKADP